MALAFTLDIDGIDLTDITIADVRVSTGRQSPSDAVEAGALTITVHHAQTGMNGALALGKTVRLTVDVAGRRCPLFVGTITDVDASAISYGMWAQQVIATGPLAALTRIEVAGAWPAETDSQRIAHLLEAGGQSSALVPALPGPLIVARTLEDDSEALDEALMLVADSAGGLIYEDHTGGLIGYQPQLARYRGKQSLWDLSTDTWDSVPGDWNSPGGGTGQDVWAVPGEAVRLEPFKWAQHIEDLLTHCVVTYGLEGPEGEDRPTVSAGSLNPPVYSDEIDTALSDYTDALALADRLVATRSVPRWNAPATVLHLDRLPDSDIAMALTERLTPGRPVDILTMPPGSPYADFHGFLEGWEHRITGDPEGWLWDCELWLSDEALTMPMTTWDQIAGTWDSVSDPWNTALIGG